MLNGKHDDVFDRAVTLYRRRVFTFATYLLSSADEAEDVTQEVLVRLWRAGDAIPLERIEPRFSKMMV